MAIVGVQGALFHVALTLRPRLTDEIQPRMLGNSRRSHIGNLMFPPGSDTHDFQLSLQARINH